MATTTSETRKTLVDYRKDGGIAILTLNDPPANTYTHEMMRDLDECIVKVPHHLVGVRVRRRIVQGQDRDPSVLPEVHQRLARLARRRRHRSRPLSL